MADEHFYITSQILRRALNYPFNNYRVILVNDIAIPTSFEASFLLTPRDFRFFSICSGTLEITFDPPQGSSKELVSHYVTSFLSFLSSLKQLKINTSNGPTYMVLAEKFENNFLSGLAEISSFRGESAYDISSLHHLSYSYSEFSLLNDFMLLINDFQIQCNRFLLCCLSQKVNCETSYNRSLSQFSISLTIPKTEVLL